MGWWRTELRAGERSCGPPPALFFLSSLSSSSPHEASALCLGVSGRQQGPARLQRSGQQRRAAAPTGHRLLSRAINMEGRGCQGSGDAAWGHGAKGSPALISPFTSQLASAKGRPCVWERMCVCVWFCRRDLQSQHHLIKLCLRENEQKKSVKGLFPSPQFLFYCECTFPETTWMKAWRTIPLTDPPPSLYIRWAGKRGQFELLSFWTTFFCLFSFRLN